jgi:hypothetical protein
MSKKTNKPVQSEPYTPVPVYAIMQRSIEDSGHFEYRTETGERSSILANAERITGKGAAHDKLLELTDSQPDYEFRLTELHLTLVN